MKNECSVIEDLLPLYLDEVCSEASKKMVEEHLLHCDDCRIAVARMQTVIHRSDSPVFSGQEILKKTSWNIAKRAVAASAGITAIILYWLIFLWQEALSEVGDYRYISYRFHEMYSIGYLLIPIITTIWLTVMLIRSGKEKVWRKNVAILLVLAVLTAGQWGFIHQQSQTVGVTCVSQVVEIRDEYHIVIESWKGNVTLETAPAITRLLDTDGTKYVITYETTKGNEDVGKLSYASKIEN